MSKDSSNKPIGMPAAKDSTVAADDRSVPWGVGSSIFVSLGAFLLPQFIIGFILAAYASNTDQNLSEFFDSNQDNFLLNFGLTLFISVVGSYIIYRYVSIKKGLAKLGFRRPSIDDVVLVIPAYVIYFVLLVVANIVLAATVTSDVFNQEQEVGFDGASGTGLLLAFVTLVILAPLYEELIFRGFAFRGVAAKFGFWPAAIGTSAVFGLAHGQINVGVDTFILGMAASWLVWNTKSIWPAILLHVLKNAIAYVFLFVIGTN